MKPVSPRRLSVVAAAIFVALPLAARAQNAQGIYREAAAQVVEKKKIGTDLTLPQKRELLQKNADALRRLREGFAFEHRASTQVGDKPYFMRGASLRQFARLFITESQVAEADGNRDRAAQSCLDAIRMGIDTPRGGPWFLTMVGYAQESTGSHALWGLLPRLDANAAERAALRLQLLETRRPRLEAMFLVERGDSWIGIQQTLKGNKAGGWNETQARAALDAMIAEETRAAALPFRADPSVRDFRKIIEEHEEDEFDTTAPQLLELSRSLLYDARFQNAFNRAQNALLTASLARRAYVLRNKREPESLSDLVTAGLLETIPLDPFSGAALRFRKAGEKSVIYSIGPDGTDNLGRAIAFDGKYKNTQPQSKGDIVAERTLR